MGAEEQNTVVDVDLAELDEGVDHDERERRRDKAYTVGVRTPAGFEARVRVYPNERVEIESGKNRGRLGTVGALIRANGSGQGLWKLWPWVGQRWAPCLMTESWSPRP